MPPAPPEKGNAALRGAAISKLTGLAEGNSGSGFTQACAHSATLTERLPDSHPHFARLTCAVCGKHLRWLPRPSTLARQRVNAFRLSKLAMHPGLSDWERNFLRDISQRRKLSPKQQTLLVRLCATYLEAQT